MTEFRVIYSPEALEDLRRIYRYIADELLAEQAAIHQTEHIQDEIDSLSHYPDRHQLVLWEPWHSIGLRQIPVDHYIVYYLADAQAETVSVVRILYGGRDVKRILTDSL